MDLSLSTILDPDTEADSIVSAPFIIDAGDTHDPEPADDPRGPNGITEQDHAPSYMPPPPVPVLPTVPLAGVVLDSGTIDVPAGTRNVIIGTSPDARPFVLGIVLRWTAGAGSCVIAPNSNPDGLGLGYTIPNTADAEWYPAKRLALQLVGPITVTYAVFASDIPHT